MKIEQLDMHCGNCRILGLCAEPFEDLCLCAREALKNMEESAYLAMAEKIRDSNRRPLSNTEIADRICASLMDEP